jgi:integrase
MRGLFTWAIEAQHVKHDPTAGVTDPARRKNAGFRIWTEDEVQKYEKRWPVGTRERVWLDVLLYTGLRRGDAVRLRCQHVRGGIATLKVQKSGYRIEVALPILPILKKTLDAGPCGDLAFIAGARGAPLAKESFGNLLRDACKEAGVPGRAHGLRKLGATCAANNGATVHELQALFGWVDIKMPALYTRGADRRRLAVAAAHKLVDEVAKANVERTSIPAPSGEVRAKIEKTK